MKADGFGIGWYDPLASTSSSSSLPDAAQAGTAEEALEEHNKAFEPVHVDQVVEGLSEMEIKDVLRKREEAAERENERPCVFKSLSPVSRYNRCGYS